MISEASSSQRQSDRRGGKQRQQRANGERADAGIEQGRQRGDAHPGHAGTETDLRGDERDQRV